jgi:spore germination protein KC
VKRLVRLGVVLLLLASLTGCWDNRSIETRDLVLTLGVAPAPHGNLAVYLQSPPPDTLTAITQAGGGGGGGPSAPIYVYGVGKTVDAALVRAQASTQRDLYLGQVVLVLLSSRLSARQFQVVLHTLMRLPLIHTTAYVAVTPTAMNTFMTFSPAETRLAPLYFETLFTCQQCQAVSLQEPLFELERTSITPGRTMYAPVIMPLGNGYEVDRIVAYSAGSRPALTLSPAQTIDLGFVLGRTVKASEHVSLGDGARASVRAITAQTHFATTDVGGRLHIAVDTNIKGTLANLEGHRADSETVVGVEQAVASALARKMLAVLTALQRKGADPAGFGEAFLWNHPEYLARWHTLYRRAAITVHVHVVLQDLGATS